MNAFMHTDSYTCTDMHRHMHEEMHTHVHMRDTSTYTHAHAQMHACTHRDIQTHRHTCTLG